MIDLGKLLQACVEPEGDCGDGGPALVRGRLLLDPGAIRELRCAVEVHIGSQELERLIALIRDMNDHLVALASSQILVSHVTGDLTRRACCVLARYEC